MHLPDADALTEDEVMAVCRWWDGNGSRVLQRRAQIQARGDLSAIEIDTADPLVWTVPEAAKILSVSGSTIREMAARGELKSYRIGNRTKIPKIEMQRYLAHGPNPTQS